MSSRMLDLALSDGERVDECVWRTEEKSVGVAGAFA